MQKACLTCGLLKADTEFYKAPRSPQGLRAYCKSCDNVKRQAWREANRDKQRQANQSFSKTEERKAYQRAYRKERRKNDPTFRARLDISSRIANHLRLNGYGHKTEKLEAILGCTFDDLQAHLMQTAIDRYGYWLSNEAYHVDHIVPLASATSEAEILSLNHYSNLQLLTPEENQVKGCR